jgi:hypothetical protein
MRAWLVCGWQRINARFFLLDLETEAGTYVKEFVRFIPGPLFFHFTFSPPSAKRKDESLSQGEARQRKEEENEIG